jgi:hypothetical protein
MFRDPVDTWTTVHFSERLLGQLGGLDEEVVNWLEIHVGHRYKKWGYPDRYYLTFENPRHATLFKLTWGGR